MKDPTEPGKGQLVSFQEGLLRSIRESAVEGRSAGHAAQGKHIQLRPLAGQIGVSFVPIDLGFHAPFIALGHADFPCQQSQGVLPVMHVLAHGPFRHRAVWQFLTQAHPNPVRRMPLLPRRLAITLQDLVNERDRRLQFRVRPFRFLPRLGQGAGNRLPHHSPVYLHLPGHARDRPYAKLIFASNLFK